MLPAWRNLSVGVAAAAMLGACVVPAWADRALVIGIDDYSDIRLTLGGGSSAHDAGCDCRPARGEPRLRDRRYQGPDRRRCQPGGDPRCLPDLAGRGQQAGRAGLLLFFRPRLFRARHRRRRAEGGVRRGRRGRRSGHAAGDRQHDQRRRVPRAHAEPRRPQGDRGDRRRLLGHRLRRSGEAVQERRQHPRRVARCQDPFDLRSSLPPRPRRRRARRSARPGSAAMSPCSVPPPAARRR